MTETTEINRPPPAAPAAAPLLSVRNIEVVYDKVILVLRGLSPFEQDLLDAYEGEEYRRALLPVMIGEELHEAFAYLPVIAVPAAAAPWSLAEWQARHKPRLLAGELAAIAELRLKLIATRPH